MGIRQEGVMQNIVLNKTYQTLLTNMEGNFSKFDQDVSIKIL